MKKYIYLLVTAVLFCVFDAGAQKTGELKPVYGQKAIRKKIFETPEVNTLRMSADTGMRAPLKFKLNYRKFRNFKPHGSAMQEAPSQLSQNLAAEDDTPEEAEPAEKEETKANIWSNFLAASFEEFPYFSPPDPSGDVSSFQVVVATNASIKVFDKKEVTEEPTTTPEGKSRRHARHQLFILLDEFFAPLLSPGSYAVDPHVRFDRLTQRWFFAAIEVNPEQADNHLMVVVSDGERINQSSSFYYYRLRTSEIFNYDPATIFLPFFDYPTLGVDKNAVVVGGINFFWGWSGTDSVHFVGLLLDKKRLTTGELLAYGLQLGNINYYTGAGGGTFVPQGVHNGDASANKSFFAGLTLDQTGLALTSVTFNSRGTPTGVSATKVPVEEYNFPRDIVALGSPMPIDPLDTRLFAAAIYKNKLTGKSALYTAHAIGVDRAGRFVSNENFIEEARTASRWYEVGNIYNKPALEQYGTVYSNRPSGRRAQSFFNPSIAANGQGYMVMSGTTAAFNKQLNVFVADRYQGDARGTMNLPVMATRSKALYGLVYGNYIGRWGDFSQTVVDPDDDQTIWTFQEYANVDDSYGTRAIQIKAPPPATPMPLGLISSKKDTVVTIKGLSINHSGFFDPGNDANGPGYKRLSVKSTGGISVSNVRYISPTEISVRLNVRDKPAGTYTLAIENPDGQLVTTTYHITPQAIPPQQANDELQKAVNSIIIFPNPTNGVFRVQFESPIAFSGKAVILDVNGKALLEHSFSIIKGINQAELSLGHFTNGTYIIAVYDTNNVLVATQVVVKQ